MAHASATVSGDSIQKASARLAAHGASAAASWWAEAPPGCVAAAPPAAHDAQDSRWLQDSADSVAWADHGMPESPHEIPRQG